VTTQQTVLLTQVVLSVRQRPSRRQTGEGLAAADLQGLSKHDSKPVRQRDRWWGRGEDPIEKVLLMEF